MPMMVFQTLLNCRARVSLWLSLLPLTGLSSVVVTLVTSFTDQLFAEGLVNKILALLDNINIDREMERLGKVIVCVYVCVACVCVCVHSCGCMHVCISVCLSVCLSFQLALSLHWPS